MNHKMAVFLNGIVQLEYDHNVPLPEQQVSFLDKMDEKMDLGISVDGQTIHNPDLSQRTQFVAGNMAHALLNSNDIQALQMCTYLANRIADLKQVRIDEKDGQITIDLVFDEEYKKQVSVQFTH